MAVERSHENQNIFHIATQNWESDLRREWTGSNNIWLWRISELFFFQVVVHLIGWNSHGIADDERVFLSFWCKSQKVRHYRMTDEADMLLLFLLIEKKKNLKFSLWICAVFSTIEGGTRIWQEEDFFFFFSLFSVVWENFIRIPDLLL